MGLQLLPVDARMLHWTHGLAQLCKLLEHHHQPYLAEMARSIPYIATGQVEAYYASKKKREAK